MERRQMHHCLLYKQTGTDNLGKWQMWISRGVIGGEWGRASEIFEIRVAWGRSMDVISFPDQGICTIPLSFLSLSLFSGRKSGLIGSRLRIVFETKTETHRSRR